LISRHGRWVATRTRLRMRSQVASFLIGLALAAGASWAQYRSYIGAIRGSLLVGVGAAIIAAAIVAYLSPFNEAAFRRFLSLGIEEVWSSRQAVDDSQWVDWLDRAENTCTLLGIAHGKWCADQRFDPTLRDRIKHGVCVKMLFLNPESDAAKLRAREEKNSSAKRNTVHAITQSINVMWKFRESLGPGLKEQLRLYVYDATPSCGLMWIDRFMVVTHYLPSQPDVTSPALLMSPPQIGIERSLYKIYAKTVEDLETTLSVEIDDRNIQQILARLPPAKEA
jgi:hypothetical protein